MALQSITTVSAIPTDPPDHPNLSGKVFRSELGNAVELLLRVEAGTGTCLLLRWRPEIGKWAPWGADGATGTAAIDASKRGGWCHARWATGQLRCGDWTILVEGGPPPPVAEAWLGALTL